MANNTAADTGTNPPGSEGCAWDQQHPKAGTNPLGSEWCAWDQQQPDPYRVWGVCMGWDHQGKQWFYMPRGLFSSPYSLL